MDPLQIPSLGPLQPLQPLQDGLKPTLPGADGGPDFSDLLRQALNEVNEVSQTAEVEARNLMTGDRADMHSAMLAVQKADLSFQMMMAVRSKLIDAYREVMRMQI